MPNNSSFDKKTDSKVNTKTHLGHCPHQSSDFLSSAILKFLLQLEKKEKYCLYFENNSAILIS